MNLLNEYKEMYYHELEHTDRLNKRSTTNLTVLSILGSGEAFIWKSIATNASISFDYNKINWSLTIFSVISLISFLSFCAAIFFYIRAYFGYKYKYFPISGSKKYIDACFDNDLINGERTANKHIVKMMENLYITCAINNRNQNTNKNYNQKYENILVIITMLSETVAIIYSLVFISYVYFK